MTTSRAAGVFISYRREDAASAAGWLYDRLVVHLGPTVVFKDVDSIRPGEDFLTKITTAVGSCAVLLAVIGQRWLTVTGKAGRRLDDESDFVRLEIETALTRGIAVIPVLVDGASMPSPADLPASMQELAYKNAVELRPARFASDTAGLAKALEETLAGTPTSGTQRRAGTDTAAGTPSRRKLHEAGITMWGPPASGKTTFLAALTIALTQHRDGWSMLGTDEASSRALTKLTTDLASKGTFPEPTIGIEEYQFILRGHLQEKVRRRFRNEVQNRPIMISLDLADTSGEIITPDQLDTAMQHELISRLAHNRGIIYMFDPVREAEVGDAFDRTLVMCNQVTRTLVDDPQFDGKLPHYLAVCITKFDEEDVFWLAQDWGFNSRDPSFPFDVRRVYDEVARSFLWRLGRESGGGERVIRILEQHFKPERIRYFVMSAVGFHASPTRDGFLLAQNVLRDTASHQARVRGTVHPINVAEPLLWLSEQLAREPSPR